MDPYNQLNKLYSFYMAAIVGIISRHSLTIEEHHRNQTNKSKLMLYCISHEFFLQSFKTAVHK